MDELQQGIENQVAALTGELPGWLVWVVYTGGTRPVWRWCATFLREPVICAEVDLPQKLVAACQETMDAYARPVPKTGDVPRTGNYVGHL